MAAPQSPGRKPSQFRSTFPRRRTRPTSPPAPQRFKSGRRMPSQLCDVYKCLPRDLSGPNSKIPWLARAAQYRGRAPVLPERCRGALVPSRHGKQDPTNWALFIAGTTKQTLSWATRAKRALSADWWRRADVRKTLSVFVVVETPLLPLYWLKNHKCIDSIGCGPYQSLRSSTMEKEPSVAMEVRMLNCSFKDCDSVKFLKIALFLF